MAKNNQSKIFTWKIMWRLNVFGSCMVLLSCMAMSKAQFEESIFEDEDIYRPGLPSDHSTGITFPGTKWCGPGNTAKDYNDLGSQRGTDICCREHDHCDDLIEAGTERNGLVNQDMFTILNCRCDQKFLNCLQKDNSTMSITIGRIYFYTRKRCYGRGHPIIGCAMYQVGTVRERCVRYRVNGSGLPVWQFYDLPFFSIASTTLKNVTLFNRS